MFMVSIKKKTINRKTYYYLEHSYRKNGRVYKKEKYIGNKLPKNIDKLKEKLLLELYEELWFKQFDKIKNNILIKHYFPQFSSINKKVVKIV